MVSNKINETGIIWLVFATVYSDKGNLLRLTSKGEQRAGVRGDDAAFCPALT